jgi:diaminopimelate decarboxylase
MRAIAAEAGLGAEVTAPADLENALATLPGSRVVLQGASPSAAALDRALSAGALVGVDGPDDAARLIDRAKALGAAPRYLLRLRPSSVTAEQASFGMKTRDLVALARRIIRGRGPAPEGIAFHLGTRISSPAPFDAALREAADAAAALRAIGALVRVLDVGGGFPSVLESSLRSGVRAGASPLRIADMVRREAARRLPGARLLAEPGRAIAADAFHLVARVVGVRGRSVRLDASRMSHAYFVPRGRHAFLVRPRRDARAPKSEIRGPLAVGLDVFSAGERVGRPRVGDLVVIAGIGAYNLIAANAWATGSVPEVVAMSKRTY